MCFENISISAFILFSILFFCHHLTDHYVDLSGLYVDLSVISVELLDHNVDLSEKYHQNY